MDLNHLFQVVRRNRWLTVGGLLVGLVLAALTFRSSSVTYSSRSVLFVTQQGFPWGSTLGGADVPAGVTNHGPTFAAPSRFIDLAGLYAGLATSDVIRLRVVPPGEKLKGQVFASQLQGSGKEKSDLPLMEIIATAKVRADAFDIASRFTAGLQDYLTKQQIANKIPEKERVILDPVREPSIGTTEVAQGRAVTRPGAIFLAVLILTLAIAFARENRRSTAAAAEAAGDAQAAAPGDAVPNGTGGTNPFRPGASGDLEPLPELGAIAAGRPAASARPVATRRP